MKITLGINEVGNLIITLMESRFLISENHLSEVEFCKQVLVVCWPFTLVEAKQSVSHWLSKFDKDLASQSAKQIDEFFANPDNLILKKATSSTPSSSNVN